MEASNAMGFGVVTVVKNNKKKLNNSYNQISVGYVWAPKRHGAQLPGAQMGLPHEIRPIIALVQNNVDVP